MCVRIGQYSNLDSINNSMLKYPLIIQASIYGNTLFIYQVI